MRAKGLLWGYFCLFFTLGKENRVGGRGRGPSSRRLSFLCCRRSWRLPHIHMARSAPPECAAPLGTALPPTVSDPGPHSVHLDLMQRMEDAWFSMFDVICIPVYSQFCGASFSQPCKWGNEGHLEVAQMESAKGGPRAEATPLPPDLLGRSVPPSSENCGQRNGKSPTSHPLLDAGLQGNLDTSSNGTGTPLPLFSRPAHLNRAWLSLNCPRLGRLCTCLPVNLPNYAE